jgi:hypothetical protein
MRCTDAWSSGEREKSEKFIEVLCCVRLALEWLIGEIAHEDAPSTVVRTTPGRVEALDTLL